MLYKTVLYARCSSDNGQETASQEHALRTWAQNNGVEASYIEDIVTGKTMDRPGLNRIRKAIERKQVTKLVVWKMSRLGRNAKGVLEFLEFAVSHGCEVYSLSEKLDFTSAMGKMMVGLLALFDEFTSNIISENTKAGHAKAKAAGKMLGADRIAGMQWVSNKVAAKIDAVLSLHKDGHKPWAIAQFLGMDNHTVARIVSTPRHLLMTKKECEELARMRHEGKAE